MIKIIDSNQITLNKKFNELDDKNKCPNTIKGNNPFPHNNWLETFEDMCKNMVQAREELNRKATYNLAASPGIAPAFTLDDDVYQTPIEAEQYVWDPKLKGMSSQGREWTPGVNHFHSQMALAQ